MESLITVIHILASLFMIVVILIQGGNAGGIGAAFGGGNSQGFFGASGANTFLSRLTYICAGIFMITSVTLSVMQSNSGETGLTEKLEELGKAKESEKPQDKGQEPAK